MRYVLAFLLCISCAAEAVAVNVDIRPPTPDEVFILNLINTYRADPSIGDSQTLSALNSNLIRGDVHVPNTFSHHFNPQTKPAPALRWDPRLAAVAQASLQRFSSAAQAADHDVAPDLALVGYSDPAATHLILGEGGSNLRFVFLQSLIHLIHLNVDPKATSMATSRKHLCSLTATACGVAVGKTAKGYRLAWVTSDQPAVATVCVTIFRDANRNGTLDQQENLAPFVVEGAGAQASSSWPAGFGVIPLTSPTMTEFTLTGEGQTYTCPLQAAGGLTGATVTNTWLAIPATEPADVAKARALLEAIAKAIPDADVPSKAAFDLYGMRSQLAVDQQTAQHIDQAIAEVSAATARARKDFLEGLGDEPKVTQQRLSTYRKRWQGHGDAWCDYAKIYAKLHAQYSVWGTLEEAQKIKSAPALIKALQAMGVKRMDPVLWEQTVNWTAEVESFQAVPR